MHRSRCRHGWAPASCEDYRAACLFHGVNLSRDRTQPEPEPEPAAPPQIDAEVCAGLERWQAILDASIAKQRAADTEYQELVLSSNAATLKIRKKETARLDKDAPDRVR